jgi:hypothetical protein
MPGFYPFNPTLGQQMQSEINGVLVDRGFIAHINIPAANAIAADADIVHAAITASATVSTVVTTGFTNPTVPRNITATAGGTATDIKAVQVIVEGTNYEGEAITETLTAFTVDTAGIVTGNKAFKTVTKVTIPAMDGAGVTVTIGIGEKLGIPFRLSHNTVLNAYLDNAKEGTAPTVTVSATAIESNTVDLNSALNGKVVDIYLIV